MDAVLVGMSKRMKNFRSHLTRTQAFHAGASNGRATLQHIRL
jgi:hypothetical protein